jgi:hypothetical protein
MQIDFEQVLATGLERDAHVAFAVALSPAERSPLAVPALQDTAVRGPRCGDKMGSGFAFGAEDISCDLLC